MNDYLTDSEKTEKALLLHKFFDKYKNKKVDEIDPTDELVIKVRAMYGVRADNSPKQNKAYKRYSEYVHKAVKQAILEGYSTPQIKEKYCLNSSRLISKISEANGIIPRRQFRYLFVSGDKPDIYFPSVTCVELGFHTRKLSKIESYGYVNKKLEMPVLWKDIPEGAYYMTSVQDTIFKKTTLEAYKETPLTKELLNAITVPR